MVLSKKVLCIIAAISLVFAITACDSNDDNGGGGSAPAATTAGYSNASLAGTWEYTENRYAGGTLVQTRTGKATYDANGNLISARSSGCKDACGDQGYLRSLKSDITVTTDGKLFRNAIGQCLCWTLGAVRRTGKGVFKSASRMEETGTMSLYNLQTNAVAWTLDYVRTWRKL